MGSLKFALYNDEDEVPLDYKSDVTDIGKVVTSIYLNYNFKAQKNNAHRIYIATITKSEPCPIIPYIIICNLQLFLFFPFLFGLGHVGC